MSKEADYFARQLNFLLGLQGKTQSDIMRATGVSSGTASNWSNGRGVPGATEVRAKLCELFGVGEVFLFGEGVENAQPRDKIFLEIQRLKEVADQTNGGGVEEAMAHYGVRPAPGDWRKECEAYIQTYLDLAEKWNPARVGWLLEEMKERFPLSYFKAFEKMSHRETFESEKRKEPQ